MFREKLGGLTLHQEKIFFATCDEPAADKYTIRYRIWVFARLLNFRESIQRLANERTQNLREFGTILFLLIFDFLK